MSSEGAPQLERYEPIEIIGRGGSADVWKMRDRSGELVAVKVLREPDGLSSRAEWKVLRHYESAHVVAVKELTTDTEGRAALVMEYCAGGTLEDVVLGRGGLTVGETRAALEPVAGVLEQLHRDGVIHGDLSPRNVLFTANGCPKVADLGCARVGGMKAPQEWCTSGFTAPEVWDGAAVEACADVYSLGTVAWFALTGRAPDPPALRPHLRDEIPDAPVELAEAITSALSITPSARIDAAAFQRALAQSSPSVVVPIAGESCAAGKPETTAEYAMTKRRRTSAVHQQNLRSRHQAQHHKGRTYRWPWVAAVIAAGATAVGAALFSPTPAQDHETSAKTSARRTDHPVVPSSKPSPSTHSPQPRRTVAPVSLPQKQHIEMAIACRAQAWNNRDVQRLQGCLAPRSQALADDTHQLQTARSAGATYVGLTYTVRQVRSIVLEAGVPTARVLVAQSRYSVHQFGATQVRPAREDTVRLTFLQHNGQWKISTWDLA